MAGQQAGAAVTAIRGGAVTLAEAADAFLSSPRAASPNTRRGAAPPVGRKRAGEVEPQPGRRRVLAELVRPEEAVARPAVRF